MAQLASSKIYGDLVVTNNSKIFGDLDASSISINGTQKNLNWDAAYSHSTSAHYVHPSVNHIPTGGAAGNILQWHSSGTAVWKANGTTAQYLRGDGSWATPPNDNTASAVDNILSGSNSGTAITYQPYTTSQAATGNRFYTHNTMPTATTLLNLSSHLRITQGTIGTTLTVNGDIIGNGKVIARTTDGWLRLNPTYTSSPPATAFHSGVLIPSALSVSGNVGIGTTSPSQVLHVSGNIRADAYYVGTTRKDTVWDAKSNLALGTTSETAYRGDHGLAAYNHISSDGSSHSYINQSVTTSATPTFAGLKVASGDGTKSIHIAQPEPTYNISTPILTFGNGDYVKLGIQAVNRSTYGRKDFVFLSAENSSWTTTVDDLNEIMRIQGTGNVGIGTTSPAYALDVSGDVRATGTFHGSLTGNASTATTLETARTINGTSFDGSANITTTNWGTARTLTIGSTGKSVNGSANVSWTLEEIGAAPASHDHSASNITSGTLPIARGGTGNTTGLAASATVLAASRTINGTSFDGSANITTDNWGTARTLTIGSTGKSVNGSENIAWTIAEIGAAPASHTHSLADIEAGTFKGNEMKFYTTSTNNDMSIRIGDRDGSYGFNWIYRGTGSGNNNSLELWADDSTSGELAVKAIEVKQDGAVHIDNLISSTVMTPLRVAEAIQQTIRTGLMRMQLTHTLDMGFPVELVLLFTQFSVEQIIYARPGSPVSLGTQNNGNKLSVSGNYIKWEHFGSGAGAWYNNISNQAFYIAFPTP